MYLAAYQSHIWNRTLDRWIRNEFPDEARIEVRLRMGLHAVPNAAIDGATERFNEMILPLPSARLKPVGDEIWLPALESTLVDEGLTLEGMKVPGSRSRFFSKGERAACVRPTGMSCEEGVDELNKGKHKAIFRFDLPRGCYATMFVKRVTS